MVAAPLKILCFFGTQIYGIFSQKICTIYCLIVGMFTSICSNMLNCWPSTPISRLPASQRPKQPIFLEQAQAPAWIVRWGWMARETARLENLPQTSGNFRLARWEDSALTILSVAGVATWQVSVDLKAHRTKQLDGLEQVCQCVWSPWKEGTTRAFFAPSIYHEHNFCPALGFCSERPVGYEFNIEQGVLCK